MMKRVFFLFPIIFRCHLWLQNTFRDDLLEKTPLYLNNNCHICADHFEDEQFSNKVTKNRLKWNAVPTLFNIPDYLLEFRKTMKRKGNNNSTSQSALKYLTGKINNRCVNLTYVTINSSSPNYYVDSDNLVLLFGFRWFGMAGWTFSLFQHLYFFGTGSKHIYPHTDRKRVN